MLILRDYLVSGTVGATTLTEEEIAAHRHSVDGGQFVVGGPNGTNAQIVSPGGNSYKNYGYTTSNGKSLSHSHTFTGSTAPSSNLPPYYILSHIMRIA